MVLRPAAVSDILRRGFGGFGRPGLSHLNGDFVRQLAFVPGRSP